MAWIGERYKGGFVSLLVWGLLSGCSVKAVPAPQAQIDKLTTLLANKHSGIPREETRRLSHAIFQKTESLTREFALTSPPLWHNVLVNTGVKKRGLCYHWSDALYIFLKKEHYPHYGFHLMGANIHEYFSEHNALAVVAKGQKVEDGVIIDPWRNSGKLYFSKIKVDKAYHWIHRAKRGCGP